MPKIIVNIVKWREDGPKVFQHSGRTFQVDKEELGLVKEHTETVRIESEFPLEVTERTFTTADGKTIRNLALKHELLGLISDYYIYNDLGAK